MSVKFRDLIDKESILLDGKRLADFNKGNNLNEKIDKVMWDFLHERVHEVDSHDVLMIKEFVAKMKGKL